MKRFFRRKRNPHCSGRPVFVSDHEVVSFRKRFVRSIPVERFDQFQQRLAHVPLASSDMDDAKARLQRARQVAQTQPKPSPLPMIKHRFPALRKRRRTLFPGTNGSVLCAVDVFPWFASTCKRAAHPAYTSHAGSPFTDLVMVQERLFAVRPNESRIDKRFDGSGRREFAVDGKTAATTRPKVRSALSLRRLNKGNKTVCERRYSEPRFARFQRDAL